MQRVVHREIRSRIHRPRIVDGVPVDTEELQYVHEFSYSKDDLDALRAAKANTAKAQQDPEDDETE